MTVPSASPAFSAAISPAALLAAAPSPATLLTGHTLPSGWKLVQQLSKSPGGSGSNFCVGYIAERDGQRAFVKAMDFVKALNAPDPLVELAALTSVATFEREAMELCEANKLSRLIRLISHEYVNLDPTNNPLNRVYCLIMEIGAGDLRKQLSHVGVFSCSAVFSILADVALGMSQLHRHGVAHQDVKPSNVISMTDMSAPKDSMFKVADLGRVVRKDRSGPFDGWHWPGDGNYAPPERWYGLVPPQWTDARESSDAYMLGSLVFFLFTATTLGPQQDQKCPTRLLHVEVNFQVSSTSLRLRPAVQALGGTAPGSPARTNRSTPPPVRWGCSRAPEGTQTHRGRRRYARPSSAGID